MPRGKYSTGQRLFLSERPVFVQQKIHRKAQTVIDQRHNFLGKTQNMYPQQRKQAAQTDACDAVSNIHLNQRFLPGRTRCTEYILTIKPKGPANADHKGEKLRDQKVKAGKQAQQLQTP